MTVINTTAKTIFGGKGLFGFQVTAHHQGKPRQALEVETRRAEQKRRGRIELSGSLALLFARLATKLTGTTTSQSIIFSSFL